MLPTVVQITKAFDPLTGFWVHAAHMRQVELRPVPTRCIKQLVKGAKGVMLTRQFVRFGKLFGRRRRAKFASQALLGLGQSVDLAPSHRSQIGVSKVLKGSSQDPSSTLGQKRPAALAEMRVAFHASKTFGNLAEGPGDRVFRRGTRCDVHGGQPFADHFSDLGGPVNQNNAQQVRSEAFSVAEYAGS